MSRTKGTTYLLLLLFSLTGCTPFCRQEVVPVNNDDRALFPVSSQIQAIEQEDNEQYIDALDYWKQTENIVKLKIISLAEDLKQISEIYSQRGVTFYEEKKGHEALLVFLEALRYNPSNPVALDYLQNRYQADRFTLYSVKPADSYATIAETIYGSNTYEFIVAHFSDAVREENLQEGLLIALPQLDSYFSQPLKNYKKNIRTARKHFKIGEYDEALTTAIIILNNHPENDEASYIINRSLLKIAKELRSKQQFDKAARTLSRVDPAFKNVTPLIKEIKIQQKRLQEEDTQITNNELFELGKRYYAKKDYPKALESFLQVDPSFSGVQQIISDTRRKMQFEAEFHFKEGVKLFVEEKLAAAIIEWQKTLELSPDHSDAIISIEKARRLLEKVKTIN